MKGIFSDCVPRMLLSLRTVKRYVCGDFYGVLNQSFRQDNRGRFIITSRKYIFQVEYRLEI